MPPVEQRSPDRWTTRQRLLLLVLSGNMVLDAIEVSLVLLALPVVGAVFGLSPWGAQWLMSGFAAGFAVMLLIGHRVMRWGRRRVYLVAMLLFVLTSVVGGATDSAVLLVATRVVKGLCAALTAPTGLAIIGEVFPEGASRRKAVTVYSFLGALGFTIGLLLAGGLLAWSWRWVFLFPAPVALVLLLAGLVVLPPDGPTAGGGPPRRWAATLSDRSLVRSGISAAVLNGTYQSLLVVLTYQAQTRLGWSPWVTALALLPACVPLAVSVPFAGRLVERVGTAPLILLGAIFPMLGYLWYLAVPDRLGYAGRLLPTLLLVEAGFVCAFVPLNMRALASTDARDRATAVSLYQILVQAGAVALLPSVAAVLSSSPGHRPAALLVTMVSAAGLLIALLGLATDRAAHRRTEEAR